MDELFLALSKSKFRSSFHLSDKDVKYINERGFETIESHAYDFVRSRLVLMDTLRDGKQTPFKGHPVFVAQHATATCCRGCLEKWHHISKCNELTIRDIDYIVQVIMFYIRKEVKEH